MATAPPPKRAPVLKHGDDGRAERERVGLGLRRVLADRVARAVARDLSGDDLAVALDDVCRVGRDDVAAGAAADAVARTVAVGGDAVVALAGGDRVTPGPADHHVGAGKPQERVIPRAPVEHVGPRRSFEDVRPRRAGDGGRGREARRAAHPRRGLLRGGAWRPR